MPSALTRNRGVSLPSSRGGRRSGPFGGGRRGWHGNRRGRTWAPLFTQLTQSRHPVDLDDRALSRDPPQIPTPPTFRVQQLTREGALGQYPSWVSSLQAKPPFLRPPSVHQVFSYFLLFNSFFSFFLNPSLFLPHPPTLYSTAVVHIPSSSAVSYSAAEEHSILLNHFFFSHASLLERPKEKNINRSEASKRPVLSHPPPPHLDRSSFFYLYLLSLFFSTLTPREPSLGLYFLLCSSTLYPSP